MIQQEISQKIEHDLHQIKNPNGQWKYKRCSESLGIRKMQTHPQMKYDCTTTRMMKIEKKKQLTNKEKSELS